MEKKTKFSNSKMGNFGKTTQFRRNLDKMPLFLSVLDNCIFLMRKVSFLPILRKADGIFLFFRNRGETCRQKGGGTEECVVVRL